MPIPAAAIPALIAAASGGIKAIGGGIQALTSGERKRQKELAASIEAIPDYLKSPSILSYYQQAQQRAGISPTQTAAYKRQMQNIQRAGATGLMGAQGARGRMGAASTIARSMMDATQAAETAGELEQNRRFGQLGQATGMQAGEERMSELRKLQKQQQRIALAESRAQGAAAMKRAGLTNIFGGLTDIGKGISGDESGEFLKLFKKK
jgi:hypothetical protein